LELVPLVEDLFQQRNDLELAQETIKSNLQSYAKQQEKPTSPAKAKKLKEADFFAKLKAFDGTVEAIQKEVEEVLAEDINYLEPSNKAQIAMTARMKAYLEIEDKIHACFKKDINQLTELWTLADKNLKAKNDKTWGDLNRGDKQLETALENYTKAKEEVGYWCDNITWLQERFPEAIYQDVVGLCKMADASEYAEEQGYSMNAGRYVGVEIEDDNITREDFKEILHSYKKELEKLNYQDSFISKSIEENLKQLLNEMD
jgi:type I restriction enzyme M protein